MQHYMQHYGIMFPIIVTIFFKVLGDKIKNIKEIFRISVAEYQLLYPLLVL
jgi:hypothetical protein